MNNEVIGVLASLFVLTSFAFNKEKYIRSVNFIGAGLFCVYGVMINSFSVWFLNMILMIIHIQKLHRMRK